MGLLLYVVGSPYVLPLPLTTFQWAGAAVVGISFVMMTTFASHRTGPTAIRYPRREVAALNWVPGNSLLHTVGGFVGVVGLLTVIVIGLFGPTDPTHNMAVYLTWVYLWAGMAVVTGLVGPIWDVINPFVAVDRIVTRIRQRNAAARTDAESADAALAAPAARPAADPLAHLGIWPAVGLFFLFGLFDVTGVSTNRPWSMALLALAYTVFTVAGMQRAGAGPWLAHVEFFSVLFAILRRFAPLDVRNGRVYLRPMGAGLLDRMDAGWDWVAFVILMLSTLAFDAILTTSVWDAVVSVTRPWWSQLGTLIGLHVLQGLAFVALTLVFLGAFVVCMELVVYFATIQVDSLSTATVFALTLVPIAFVYNAAHNYASLVVQSQQVIPLLADPFGRGWHLLPTGGYQPSLLLAASALVWYVQVVLIVTGHVIAMYLAHLRAGERFRAAQGVLLSQYPILVLMVVYTMTSLWILAQPITKSR
ncbi:MAG TPA: hypothetical protein VE953_07650 [Terriglobales bacterium]|nr:hypothetical protein [Terriglobales bacterium]